MKEYSSLQIILSAILDFSEVADVTSREEISDITIECSIVIAVQLNNVKLFE